MKINLSKIDTTAPKSVKKEATKKKLEKLLVKISDLQNLLFAEGKHSLLVILQGMDASGKDGVVRHVFGSMNPMGCDIFAFKKPTDEEMKHDFLWRIHKCAPAKGMTHVFNRSHYEDVVAQKVHHWVGDDAIKKRYEHINDFEKLLMENGTVVLKFYLHISYDEQISRLDERMSDPTKMWKYNEEDIKERSFWKQYMRAYEEAFENCSKHGKWHIIPSDPNWYKEYLIAEKVVQALEELKMKFPGMKP